MRNYEEQYPFTDPAGYKPSPAQISDERNIWGRGMRNRGERGWKLGFVLVKNEEERIPRNKGWERKDKGKKTNH
jgi:hypothetical protein